MVALWGLGVLFYFFISINPETKFAKVVKAWVGRALIKIWFFFGGGAEFVLNAAEHKTRSRANSKVSSVQFAYGGSRMQGHRPGPPTLSRAPGRTPLAPWGNDGSPGILARRTNDSLDIPAQPSSHIRIDEPETSATEKRQLERDLGVHGWSHKQKITTKPNTKTSKTSSKWKEDNRVTWGGMGVGMGICGATAATTGAGEEQRKWVGLDRWTGKGVERGKGKGKDGVEVSEKEVDGEGEDVELAEMDGKGKGKKGRKGVLGR